MLQALNVVPRNDQNASALSSCAGSEVAISTSAGPLAQSWITQGDSMLPGLSVKELIAIIKVYRGNATGLQALSRKELVALLRFYRVSDHSSL